LPSYETRLSCRDRSKTAYSPENASFRHQNRCACDARPKAYDALREQGITVCSAIVMGFPIEIGI
jgi:hypothetical protein